MSSGFKDYCLFYSSAVFNEMSLLNFLSVPHIKMLMRNKILLSEAAT